MTAALHLHPSAVARGIENARHIIRAAKGTFDEPLVLEACGYLEDYGHILDIADAQRVRSAIARDANQSNDEPVNRGGAVGVVVASVILVLASAVTAVVMVAL